MAGLHEQIHRAATQAVQALDVSDLFPGQAVQTYRLLEPDSPDWRLPAHVLSVAGQIERPGRCTDSLGDSRVFPVLWMFCDRDRLRKVEDGDAITEARSRVYKAFHRKRLAGVPEVVEGLVSFQNLLMQDSREFSMVRSALLLEFTTYEPREV